MIRVVYESPVKDLAVCTKCRVAMTYTREDIEISLEEPGVPWSRANKCIPCPRCKTEIEVL